jgi:hypothetical protein
MSAQQFSSAASASIVSDIITTPPSVVVGRYRTAEATVIFWTRTLHDSDAYRDLRAMPDVLRVECTGCARKGRYSVRRLIEKYGRKANMMKWKEQLNGDCPRRNAHGLHERCDLICPDLPKVLLKDGSA